MTSPATVALDVGRSALKVSYRETSTGRLCQNLIPSAVIPAFKITDATEAERAAKDTVTVHGQPYFVGTTALMQARESDNALTDEWVYSNEYLALLTHGLNQSGAQNPLLMLGLPSRAARLHRQKLKDHVIEHFGLDAKVMPQPMGIYYSHMLNDIGVPTPGRVLSRESWAAVDVGRYSTDLILILDGVWIEQVSESCAGVVTAVDHLRRSLRDDGVELDFTEAEAALRTKSLRWYGKQRDISPLVDKAIEHLTNDITSTVTRLLSDYVRKLDGVLVGGGGAQFVADAFRARWPHVVIPEDIRFAVAEGMRRSGEAHIRAQLKKRSA
ncbi:ParM/StbA family protein [Acidihalobacter aeolianus]|nr:ParM/StbA family protein [Acidihalobacter aeolianus]